jgi:hypothetical protein
MEPMVYYLIFILTLLVLFFSFKRKSYLKTIEQVQSAPFECPKCKSFNTNAGVSIGFGHLRRALFTLDTKVAIPRHFLKIPTVCKVCLDCGHFWSEFDVAKLEAHLKSSQR